MTILTTLSILFGTGMMAALALPLLSAIVCMLVRDKYGWLIAFLSPLFLLTGAVFSIAAATHLWNEGPVLLMYPWFSIGETILHISFIADRTSLLMMVVVSVVSFLVHLYSVGYMAEDAAQKKYFCMLGLFTFAMLGIVLSANLLVLFVFWELVGFASFMLIGHWNEKPEAADAAKRAFIFNRVGDAGFVIGLMAVWTAYGTFNIGDIDPAVAPPGMAILAGLGVLAGVLGKSAQFPLFGWLPKAMEGPTPVSALIHAATMVAAGVYLLNRVFFLFTPLVLSVIAVVGAITALAGALAALSQFDIKRVLAYSTMSQLGLMVMAVGAGAPAAAMLHLFTHAFFKAGLFLAAGCIIHALHSAQHQSHHAFDVQDVRNLGGLRKRLPVTFAAFVVCGAALAGLPLTTGFLSKEAILESAFIGARAGAWHWIPAACALAVSFLTPLYIFRLIWKVFIGPEHLTRTLSISEAPQVMRAPVLILALCSLWPIVSLHPFDFNGWVYASFGGSSTHALPWLGAMSVIWIVLALGLAYLMRTRTWDSAILHEAFYFDKLIYHSVEVPAMRLGRLTTRMDKRWIDGALMALTYGYTITAHVAGWFDRTVIDGVVNGVAWTAKMVGYFPRRLQRDGVQLYVFWAVLATIIFIIWTLL